MSIQDMLANKFMEIVSKHHNPRWAREELEWLVFEKHKNEYDKLSDSEKDEVLHYMDALIKLHGGN